MVDLDNLTEEQKDNIVNAWIKLQAMQGNFISDLPKDVILQEALTLLSSVVVIRDSPE